MVSNAERIPSLIPSLQDLLFDGGVVQVIATPLIPPTIVTETANNFNLNAFEGALYAADLIDTVLTTSDITIFAASNEAFQALGPAISSMTSQELAKVLQYTILPQVIYSSNLTNNTQFVASNGENITVTHINNNHYANSAQIITFDILIANGVMHVIDNVLNPQEANDEPNIQLATQVPVFPSASMATNIPFTNSLPYSTSASTKTSSAATTDAAGSPTGVSSSSSKARAASARETGFGGAGFVAALGGALLMI